MAVITRFAPSPTGLFHVGSTRTALFNWMWAKATGGKFLLRIEDTDTSRSTKESEENIIRSLEILNLKHDGEIYFASAHKAEQVDAAFKLVADSLAYYCDCTPEDIVLRANTKTRASEAGLIPIGYDGYCRDKNKHSGVVRLKNRGGDIAFEDAISGLHTMKAEEFGDFPILKSSGDPLFLLQNAFDDAQMQVNWVIRGADHLTNNGRYILVWEALQKAKIVNLELPSFAHLPLIMGPSGKKLSKRRDKVAIDSYINEEGILPSALLTYLSSLGWGAPEGSDRLKVSELAEVFDIHDVGVANAVMDPLKLRAINADHVRELAVSSPHVFMELIKKHLGENWDFSSMIEEVATRISTFEDARALLTPIFEDQEIPAKAAVKWLKPEHRTLLAEYLQDYESINWDENSLSSHAHALAEKHQLGMLKATMPVRVAALRSDKGLPLFVGLVALGKEKTISRIKEYAQ